MMVWWRFKSDTPGPWHFGWKYSVPGGLTRMGLWNGDCTHGPVVDLKDIETRPYSG